MTPEQQNQTDAAFAEIMATVQKLLAKGTPHQDIREAIRRIRNEVWK